MTRANSGPVVKSSKPPQPARRWASVKDAAEHLGVVPRTIRQMISDGRLRAYHNGARLVRVDLNELDASMRPFGGAQE